jgi:hypothetical protein
MARGRFEVGKSKGRPAGAKNLKTREKSAARNIAVAKARTEVATRKRNTVSVAVDPVETAIPGISPKDLMLTAMRQAWADHKAKVARAGILDDEAAAQMAEALAIPALDGEAPPAHRERIGKALEAVKSVTDAALAARGDARAALTLALECSMKAAPYEHAKLVTTDGKQDTQVTVVIKQF